MAVCLPYGTQQHAFAQFEFGEPSKVVNVNEGPPVGESGSHLSPDALSFYFSSDRRPDPSYPEGEFYMYRSTRDSIENDWSTPQPLPVELNQGGDSEPSISSDGLSLYFGRGDEIGLARGADIFVATRDHPDAAWGEPQPVPGINASSWSDLTPDISANGLEIYFSSDRPGGKGSADLWVSRRADVTQPWNEPENLDINKALWEAGPDLSPDGLSLFFHAWPASQPSLQFSDVQIWVSQRETLTSPWQTPMRLPEAVNRLGALSPHLSPDGSTLYYSTPSIDTSNLTESLEEMDIWQVDVLVDVLEGDFNRNRTLDEEDIDLLSMEQRAGTNHPTFDLNSDGFVDARDRLVWVHELRRTYFGDANLDGEFNSIDLVVVFVAGKYQTDQDAGWAAGDWDGDGVFGSGDLVAAFQESGYEQGPRSSGPAVPEPSSALLMLVFTATIAVTNPRKR